MTRHGFTLIELLVVIAIIAILAATLMPSYSTTNDRANVAECKSNLTAIYLAIQMWTEDHGSRPDSLEALYERGYITDDSMLRCSKTGEVYFYNPDAGKGEIMCSGVEPDTPRGKRPHSFRQSYVALYGGGKIEEIGRKTNAVPDYDFEKE